MSEEHHDIPEWYIPDEEQVLANEHEKEQIEENGELDEPLCPHCGRSYREKDGSTYIHAYVRKNHNKPFEATKDNVFKIGLLCSDGHTRTKLNGFMDASMGDIR